MAQEAPEGLLPVLAIVQLYVAVPFPPLLGADPDPINSTWLGPVVTPKTSRSLMPEAVLKS
jgi:hypothetical protein